MNIGEFPEGMSLVRRDHIETLEMVGYDRMPGVDSDWRNSMSDDQLRAAVVIATMREVVDAAEAYTDADTPENEQRCHAALDRQKELLSRIAKEA